MPRGGIFAGMPCLRRAVIAVGAGASSLRFDHLAILASLATSFSICFCQSCCGRFSASPQGCCRRCCCRRLAPVRRAVPLPEAWHLALLSLSWSNLPLRGIRSFREQKIGACHRELVHQHVSHRCTIAANQLQRLLQVSADRLQLTSPTAHRAVTGGFLKRSKASAAGSGGLASRGRHIIQGGGCGAHHGARPAGAISRAPGAHYLRRRWWAAHRTSGPAGFPGRPAAWPWRICDMRTLAQATWLNDEVISMWLGLLNVRTGVFGGFCPPWTAAPTRPSQLPVAW